MDESMISKNHTNVRSCCMSIVARDWRAPAPSRPNEDQFLSSAMTPIINRSYLHCFSELSDVCLYLNLDLGHFRCLYFLYLSLDLGHL